MAQLTEQHLEKHATEVVNGYFNEDIALTDGVVKVAERENFNPEQIKRLVEATNNMAFQRKFGEAEGPDKMDATEFQTADPNAAIQRLIGAAKDVMESMSAKGSCPAAGDLTEDLPTTRPEVEPLDMAGPEDNLNKVSEPRIRGHIMIMKLHKTAERLQDQAYQKRVNFTEAFQKLATTFTRLHGQPRFEDFEKDAFYKWGSRAAPHLQLLRKILRKEEASYDHDAMTKTARVIDSRTKEMQLFYNMVQCSEEITRLNQAMDKTAEYMKKAEQCPS